MISPRDLGSKWIFSIGGISTVNQQHDNESIRTKSFQLYMMTLKLVLKVIDFRNAMSY